MHPLRSLYVIALCLMVAVTAVPTKPIAAESSISAITVLVNADLPNSDNSKFPHVVGIGSQVFASGHDGSKASYWKKADSATSWPSPTSVGTAAGQSDYASVTITRGPDGSAYVAWIDQNAKKVYMRRVKPDGTMDDTKTVAGNDGTFRVYVEIAVATDGRIFVVWSEDFRFRYRTSTDGGNTWTGTQIASSKTSQGSPSIAAGPNGLVILAHGGANGSIYAAIWNGSGWDDQTIATGGGGDEFLADSTVSIAANGKAYMAWRRVGGGIYYAERQSNGTWPISKLADGAAYGSVAIAADSQNNLHLNWISNISGATDMYYAFKPNGAPWQGPLRTPGGGFITNPKASATTASRVYGHAVAEDFTGGTVRARYFLYDTGVTGGPGNDVSATPLNTYAKGITKDNPFTLGFSDVIGNPDQVRYHWDVAPTNADQPQTFGTSIQVPAPQSISPAACETHTLYTQVISSTNHITETQAKPINFTFDTGVQAYIRATNPFLAGLPTTYSTNDVYVNGAGGAYDGDPNYTRMRQFFLGIYGGGDCSGLNNFVVVGGEAGPISGTSFEKRTTLPGGVDIGPKPPFPVIVFDKLNNVATPSFTLTYDPPNTDTTGTQTNTLGLPVLGSGGVISDTTTENSIIRSLSFSGITVTDNLYGQAEGLPPGRQFWGVWLANGPRNQQTPNPNDPNLTWFPLPVPSHNSPFTVQWNLFNGQDVGPRLDQDGTYIVYARFLDGAGNATTQAISATVMLQPGYSIPKLSLPIVTK